MISQAMRKDSVLRSSGISALVVALVVGSSVGLVASFFDTSPASAGTSSEKTIAAATYDPDVATSPMPNLAVTVSQTSNLTSQGITVSWTGGALPSRPSTSGSGGENYMQIAQCWGGTDRPDRTSCQYGAFQNISAFRENSLNSMAFVNPHDVQYTAPGSGQFDPPMTSIPFVSATGVTVSNVAPNPNSLPVANVLQHFYCQGTSGEPVFVIANCPAAALINVNSNEFFTKYTSNEVPWAPSASDGSGSVKFEIQTVLESPGLGCGSAQTVNGTTTGQSCWLVVIPRGTKDVGQESNTKSGLFWDAWEHNLAFKLDFKPVGVRCQIGGAEKQISGSELMTQAVSQWQPALCAGSSGAAFVASTGDESAALASASGTKASPLAMTSRPLNATDDPLVYAPIAVSSLALTFTIDRQLDPEKTIPADIGPLAGSPFSGLKLTPRLVAKLLTNSYLQSLPFGASLTQVGYIGNVHPGHNSQNLTQDPEFLAINDPEWQYMKLNGAALGDLLVPQGHSDMAYQLWAYVMSDQKARDFMAGTPDENGMVVNAWYSSNAAINPSTTGMALPRPNFPKADPIEKTNTYDAVTNPNGTGALDLVAYRPYVSDFQTGALKVLRGEGQVIGGWDSGSIPAKWGKPGRSLLGNRQVLALTTLGASARFQNVTAQLLNPAGQFVAPSTESMSAATAAMTPTANPSVYGFDFSSDQAKAATTAYPLTMPVYAALNPLQSDAGLREAYAGFIRYAVQGGQTPGTDIGQLPDGYSPLPASWVNQALQAASAIQSGVKPAAPVNLGNIAQGSYAAHALPSVSVPAVVGSPTAVDASGTAAGALSTGATPADPKIGPLALAVPSGLLSGSVAAIAIPFISRRRLRAS